MSDELLPATRAYPRFAEMLATLACRPPQSLLIEGGDEKARLDFALYWGLAANCPAARREDIRRPCLACPTCRQFAANENADLIIYDGRISNKQDDEHSSAIRAMRMENIRDLKAAIATLPHGAGKRIAIFQGISLIREEAQNSLLKVLEEPCSTTLFILLAPLRDQILPTLVSRSLCLTLPWPDSQTDADAGEWDARLATFLRNGQGFLDDVGKKGAVDAIEAERILMRCQKAFIRTQSGKANEGNPLDKSLAPLQANCQGAGLLVNWLNEALFMLRATVAPARVLEAFATRLHSLLMSART